MYPSKNLVLCLFYAAEQANAWKMWAAPLLTAAAFLPISRWGGRVAAAVGESRKTGWKSFHNKNMAVYFLIVGLTTSEHFLPELKDVAFFI